MFLALRFRLLVLAARILCPQSIAPPHPATQTGSIQPPDFVDDITPDEIDACNAAFLSAWGEMLDDPDVITNTRGFLEGVYRK